MFSILCKLKITNDIILSGFNLIMSLTNFLKQLCFLNDIIKLDMANLLFIIIIYHSFEIFLKLNGNFENTNKLKLCFGTLCFKLIYPHCSINKSII